jgi:hypothetical protein
MFPLFVKGNSYVAQHCLWFSTCMAVVVVDLYSFIGCGCRCWCIFRCYAVWVGSWCSRFSVLRSSCVYVRLCVAWGIVYLGFTTFYEHCTETQMALILELSNNFQLWSSLSLLEDTLISFRNFSFETPLHLSLVYCLFLTCFLCGNVLLLSLSVLRLYPSPPPPPFLSYTLHVF